MQAADTTLQLAQLYLLLSHLPLTCGQLLATLLQLGAQTSQLSLGLCKLCAAADQLLCLGLLLQQ